MAHKGQKMYLLHPGDLKRYQKEEDFKWKDIRKIAYYPKELAEQIEMEKRMPKETKEPKIDIPDEILEMSEEELKKMIDKIINEQYTDDRIFESIKKAVSQKKVERVVINLPGWLKERLKQKSIKTGTSMNAVMRLALTEYLAKDE